MTTRMRNLAVVLFLTTAVRAAPLPFIEDDWSRALAQAKREHKPIFVDNWVPW
jgi:hypothetical protein